MSPKKFIRINHLITRKIQGDFIVLDVNKGKFYTLNSTAEKIWKLLRRPLSLDQVVSNISTEFGITQQKAEHDVKFFLNKYKQKLFIEKD